MRFLCVNSKIGAQCSTVEFASISKSDPCLPTTPDTGSLYVVLWTLRQPLRIKFIRSIRKVYPTRLSSLKFTWDSIERYNIEYNSMSSQHEVPVPDVPVFLFKIQTFM
uniref:Uncharacterized protein n=1 Tax=Cacopsylla melanoneura TaxID=428564 RepID=A0A8D9AM11_9HEMI